MHTVSTLCATSTVGIAACGYALALPQFPSLNYIPSTPPILENGLEYGANGYFPEYSPPKSSRRWLRRLSESFSSSPSTSYTPSPTSSTSSSRSRPPTRNKLVKRSPAERLSRANSPILPPRHQRRPSTAINQPPPQSNLPLHLSRPSTSGLDGSLHCPYDPESIDVWRPFFPTKRQQQRSQSASGTLSKLSKASGIRRIVPDFFKRRFGPSLVMAETVNSYPLDKDSNDASSLCTDTTSIYPASRPVSKHMGEPPRSPMPPASKRKSLTNSISYFLGAATSTKTLGRPPRPASALEMIYNHEEGVASRVYSSRRYSTSDVLQTAMHAQEMRDPLPPIDPLSLLGLGFDLESSVSIAQSEEQHSTESSPTPATFNHLPHRLSIMSASERASTLIGNESEHDFGSDTLFDSVRTRISQMTPIRADRIFDLPPVVMQPSYDPGSNDSRVTIQGYHDALESPTPESVQTTRRLGVNIVHDDEEDGWSSDWDMPSRDDGGLRPFDKLSRLGLELHSNASNTSFGTARERFSTDGSSMRETNSILDWNDGVSMNQASSAANSCRSRTIHTKESLLSMSRKGRRSIKYHRSQSMPLTNTSLRGRTTVPSENWDDDFFDEEDDGFGLGEMIIPRAIEERQASIIGHLGCVREFALLVEDLKRLREAAIAKNIRNKGDSSLWDEADGIIALATLDDDKEDAPLMKERFHRQNTWSPQRRREPQKYMDNSNSYSLSNRGSHRESALAHEVDCFGSSEVPSTPRNKRVSPTPSSISPISRKIDMNDPIEVAKSMMEKMQKRRSDHSLHSRHSRHSMAAPGKVHFDTDMLKDLVAQTLRLKHKLVRAVDGYPDKGGLRLKIRAVEDDKFDFDLDLSPIKGTMDDNIGGLEYTPVIGVV